MFWMHNPSTSTKLFLLITLSLLGIIALFAAAAYYFYKFLQRTFGGKAIPLAESNYRPYRRRVEQILQEFESVTEPGEVQYFDVPVSYNTPRGPIKIGMERTAIYTCLATVHCPLTADAIFGIMALEVVKEFERHHIEAALISFVPKV